MLPSPLLHMELLFGHSTMVMSQTTGWPGGLEDAVRIGLRGKIPLSMYIYNIYISEIFEHVGIMPYYKYNSREDMWRVCIYCINIWCGCVYLILLLYNFNYLVYVRIYESMFDCFKDTGQEMICSCCPFHLHLRFLKYPEKLIHGNSRLGKHCSLRSIRD